MYTFDIQNYHSKSSITTHEHRPSVIIIMDINIFISAVAWRRRIESNGETAPPLSKFGRMGDRGWLTVNY